MLVYNINTIDCLTNGTLGIVTGFLYDKSKKVSHILIDFGDENIGKMQREKYKAIIPRSKEKSTPIAPTHYS